MSITAAMVKELRETTGAGMMDAKKALTETNGDMEAAVDWLRTKGLAKAAKKSGRVAAEGLVAVAVTAGKGVAVEVNSETDFVGKNEEFQTMVRKIAQAALNVDSVEALNNEQIDGKAVSEILTDAIAKIGENMTLRRMVVVTAPTVVSYVHNAAAEGMGKIGVLVGLDGGNDDIGRQIAMHVAATSPASLDENDLDPTLVEREKQVLTEQARESGKPDAVIEKMIEGRMKKFFEEVTLTGQKFVINPDLTVAEAAKEAGATVKAFARVAVGEGIEKKEEDFAAEVAKTLAGN
ncbi:translation elongation factor Ts [Paracoccus sp. (in: a-proteobacteria)]|uniref:translation elongation factor Ts n=1 Tax=Paracoccus sp. TaxID=267 RepID=UPI0026E0EF69|nr:translation elongation factor Ts [Paracoccus sp. (in: a-proteobacteria)]MDO5646758.1 translation elongation factor Ts [Paracoccus sp. (in: a-proteobacteria)]